MLADPGSGKYCKQYFSKERYEFFHTRTLGHSLPTFGGAEQKEGREFAARDVRVDGEDFVLDIAPAYGLDSLPSFVRRFSFTETCVSVTDRFDYSGNGDVVERVVSMREPKELESGRIAILDSLLTYDADAIESVKIEKQTSEGTADCYTVDFALKHGANEFSYTIE